MGNPMLKLSAMVVLVPPACVTSGKTKPMCPPTRVGPPPDSVAPPLAGGEAVLALLPVARGGAADATVFAAEAAGGSIAGAGWALLRCPGAAADDGWVTTTSVEV